MGDIHRIFQLTKAIQLKNVIFSCLHWAPPQTQTHANNFCLEKNSAQDVIVFTIFTEPSLQADYVPTSPLCSSHFDIFVLVPLALLLPKSTIFPGSLPEKLGTI